MPRFESATVIFNPTAGRLRRAQKQFDEAIRALSEISGDVRLRPTTGPSSAEGIARSEIEDGRASIVVCGGDGTINEVVNGMAGSSVPLGVIPGGTANVLAVELGISRDLVRAASTLARSRVERIAVGRIRFLRGSSAERYFLLMAGAGPDARVVREIDLGLKARAGKLAYFVGGMRELLRRPQKISASAGEQSIAGSFVLASRVRNYGGVTTVCRGASLTKPDLEILVSTGLSRASYARLLTGILLGRPERAATVWRGTRVSLSSGDESVGVQVDGEFAGELPAEIEVVPDALSLLVPAEYRG